MAQRVTREMFENRYQARREQESIYGVYMGKINADRNDKVHQETDQRAIIRQKMARQRIADQEFEMAEKIYRRQHEQEMRRNEQLETDAIAQALAEQERAEIVDQKMRGLMHEQDPEYRELQKKLDLALVTQTRDQQRKEMEERRRQEREERIEDEQEMLKHFQEEERIRQQEEEAHHRDSLATRKFIQDQLRDKERRRQLLEVAQHEKDRQQVEEIVRKVQREDEEAYNTMRRKQAFERDEMDRFMRARAAMKERERQQEEAENIAMQQFTADVNERLARAQEEQKRREAIHEQLATRIAGEIQRQQRENDEYEQLCLELAEQQELQRLKEREEAEAAKIQRQIADCRRFMEETQRAKQAEKQRTRAEELRLRQQIIEQQRKVAELAEVEQEQNRLRIEKFRRELARQMVNKKEMFEAARQEELRKLALEQEREAARQKMLDEERRKLVVSHIIAMGPQAVKYLPKGVLKEEDLDYLPEDIRMAIFNSGDLQKL